LTENTVAGGESQVKSHEPIDKAGSCAVLARMIAAAIPLRQTNLASRMRWWGGTIEANACACRGVSPLPWTARSGGVQGDEGRGWVSGRNHDSGRATFAFVLSAEDFVTEQQMITIRHPLQPDGAMEDITRVVRAIEE